MVDSIATKNERFSTLAGMLFFASRFESWSVKTVVVVDDDGDNLFVCFEARGLFQNLFLCKTKKLQGVIKIFKVTSHSPQRLSA